MSEAELIAIHQRIAEWLVFVTDVVRQWWRDSWRRQWWFDRLRCFRISTGG